MGNRIRFRSARNVFDEIKFLYDEYGINYFRIVDDNFTYDRQRAIDICNLIIQNKLKIYFDFISGVMIRTLDKELIDYLVEAGGLRFLLAVESGSELIRNKVMRKNVSETQILEAAALLKKRNAWVGAFFMLGMPEETEESCLDTMRLIEKLDLDSVFMSHITPYPGTKLFEQCARDKLFTNNVNIDDLWKGEISVKNAGPTDFFIKPYGMEIEKLREYDKKISGLIVQKNAAWDKHKRESSQDRTVISG
jgi:radical SAM superfamily enzyme YgiQ (UPF0313 family)